MSATRRLVLVASTLLVVRTAAACSLGQDCDRFQCSAEPGLGPPLDLFIRRDRSIFSSPCRCLPDWKMQLCNRTADLVSRSSFGVPNMPTICICRKFGDAGNSCLQFITRCFNRKTDCGCCFNQPGTHCDQVKCAKGEPDFGGANVSCQCHHSPADYPMHLCQAERKKSVPTFYLPSYPEEDTTTATSEASKVDPNDDPHAPVFEIAGFGVSPVMILIFLLSLIAIVLILTGALLLVGHCRTRRRRAKVKRERQLARDALIQQRAEEDRYLPTI